MNTPISPAQNTNPKPNNSFKKDGQQRTVLAIRASVPGDVRRFALNLCPGPLAEDEASQPAPSEVLAHFNPRRIYKGGAIAYNSRRCVFFWAFVHVFSIYHLDLN
jgi:hypothetical protein